MKALRNSGLKMVYSIGLRVELKYPSQRKKATILSSKWQSEQRGMSRAMTKKGSQQMTNAPVMMANVLAAFRSLFDSHKVLWRTQ